MNSDIVVIGGGINGVSAAYHLAKGGARVTLIEKSFIAGGPTGHSSAIVRQHYSNPVTARMALKSLRVWQNFGEIVGGECGYVQTGFLMGVRPEDVDGLKANIALQQSVGIDTRFVSPEELRELEPHVDVNGLGGAAYEPESGYCEPNSAANAFARAARRLGAALRVGVRVTNIQTQSGHVTGVETDQGFVPAGCVLVAAGPWSTELLRRLEIDLPLIAARVKIGLYRPPADLLYRRVWADFLSQMYMRPEAGGLILAGSIAPDEAEDRVRDPDHFNEKVGLDILADFAERTARRYPHLERGEVASSYASLYDITPDWHPILDAVPGYEGAYVCAGGSGHGFKLAPAVGEMTAQLILRGKQPGDDVNLFAFDRFATGALVRGRYEYSIVA